MVAMGFRFAVRKRPEATHDVTFTLDQAGHTYEDNVGLEPTSLTITPESKRVAVIGLNGSGKTTLLQLLDGALYDVGSVRIDANGAAYDPSVKRDLKRIESMIGAFVARKFRTVITKRIPFARRLMNRWQA